MAAAPLYLCAGTFSNSGDLAFKAGNFCYNLGTEGSLTGEMDGSDATTAYRFVPGARKVTLKDKQ